jgi:hypothetical protein
MKSADAGDGNAGLVLQRRNDETAVGALRQRQQNGRLQRQRKTPLHFRDLPSIFSLWDPNTDIQCIITALPVFF